jgi:formate hydrogenlyase subunit 4
MLFRFYEVVSVLTLVVALLVAKHIPIVSELPLAQMTGIVCFLYAIFLSLRIYNAELARIRAEE